MQFDNAVLTPDVCRVFRNRAEREACEAYVKSLSEEARILPQQLAPAEESSDAG